MYTLAGEIVSLLFFSVSLVCSATVPLELPFNSTNFFGPDGPWQAVPISLGTPPQIINLLPGGTFFNAIPTHQLNKKCSHCGAGVYNSTKGASSSAFHNISFAAPASQLAGWIREKVNATKTQTILDYMEISKPPAFGQKVQVPHLDMMTGDWAVTYPNGRTAPLPIGYLSFGTQSGVQTFSQDQGFSGTVNGTFPYHWAFNQGLIASQSWTLHYGSVKLNIPGSLYMGGYDQSRILGDPGIYDSTEGYSLTLNSLSLAAAPGSTALPSGNQTTLLQAGDQSRASLPITIEAQAPYLYLPTQICDSIAANLPVSWNDSLQLYTYTTNLPSYPTLNTTALWLDFSFPKTTPSDLLSIKVPIQLLILTLEFPIVDIPTPYFPCRRTDNKPAVLGRAFLQAAFFGQNWGTSTFFLAQAPGPNLGGKSYVEIQDGDKGVKGSGTDWGTTWSTVWRDEGVAGASGENAGSGSSAGKKPGKGLSAGAIVGVVVGALFMLGMVAAGVFFWRRRRRRRRTHRSVHRMPSCRSRAPPPPPKGVHGVHRSPTCTSCGPPLPPSARAMDEKKHGFVEGALEIGGSRTISEVSSQEVYEVPARAENKFPVNEFPVSELPAR
ncbi:MAG: hypothetical protein MMC23_000174 [Stictis urceolatum]|nr:hypothetical protein [Stictis urceolata]